MIDFDELTLEELINYDPVMVFELPKAERLKFHRRRAVVLDQVFPTLEAIQGDYDKTELNARLECLWSVIFAVEDAIANHTGDDSQHASETAKCCNPSCKHDAMKTMASCSRCWIQKTLQQMLWRDYERLEDGTVALRRLASACTKAVQKPEEPAPESAVNQVVERMTQLRQAGLTKPLRKPPKQKPPIREIVIQRMKALREAGLTEPPVRKIVSKSKPKCRKVTPAMVAEFVRLREIGMSHRQIANRFGINRTTVADHLKRETGEVYQRRVTTPEIGERVKRLRAEGMTYRAIGKVVGFDNATVCRYFQRQ